MKTIVIDMLHNYECKNSHRYDAVQGNMAPVNAIYLSKKDIEGDRPARIKLTIESAD